MVNKIETLLCELERATMCSDNSSYNDVTEKQSSESYRSKIEQLYSNAVSDLLGLNDSQRAIVRKRIDEVRDKQKHFNIPTKETVDALLRDYNAQPDGKRNKSLLDDYRYCTFVLECVSIQINYLERFASLVSVENRQETNMSTNPETNINKNSDTPKVVEEAKDTSCLTVDDVVKIYKLPKNNIKSRHWRIENDFPKKGYDEVKGAYCKVTFSKDDVEDWIRNHR